MNILIFLYTLLVAYWSDVLLVVVVVGVLAFLYKRGKKDLVKSIINDFVVKAQIALGTETGTAKYNQVVSNLYSALPFLLRVLYSKSELKTYIEDTVKWLKKKLENEDVTLLSYAEEAIVKATEAAPNASSVETIVITPIKKYIAEDGTELQLVTAIDPLAVAAQ